MAEATQKVQHPTASVALNTPDSAHTNTTAHPPAVHAAVTHIAAAETVPQQDTRSTHATGIHEFARLTPQELSAALPADNPQVEIAMIWAQTTDRVIGDGHDMPWYLPEDLHHFKSSTRGYPVVMGRTSWEALEDGYRPLPQRENFVVTRNPDYSAPGGHVYTSVPAAIGHAAQWIADTRAAHNTEKGTGEESTPLAAPPATAVTNTANRAPITDNDSSAGSSGNTSASSSSDSAGHSGTSAQTLSNTVWILGGGTIYQQCMDIADRIVVTDIEMHAPQRFQVYAPAIPTDIFDCHVGSWKTSTTGHAVDDTSPLRYRICVWTRRHT